MASEKIKVQTQNTLTVALIGNPNCGKTTLFNSLTGLRYKVANYPGVTVERKEAIVTVNEQNFYLIDLPGIYSLDSVSIDEQIAIDALLGRTTVDIRSHNRPDVLIYVADATKLERSLFLFHQLRSLNIPMILAISMVDIAKNNGLNIKGALLGRHLNVPVILLNNHDKSRNKLEIQAALNKVQIQLLSGAKVSANQDTSFTNISTLVQSCVTKEAVKNQTSLKIIDYILTSNLTGLVCFLLIMALLFQTIFNLATYPMDLLDNGFVALSNVLKSYLPDSYFQELLTDGVITGISSVLIFTPQIGLLFFLLALLEDSGYLGRAAFLMDFFMRRIGLQGKAFIPLLSSFACAIPGIMATRVMPSRRDRLLTILIAPLMSCSARLPVYILLITTFFPDVYIWGFLSLRGLILFSLYALGVIGAILLAILFSKTLFRNESSNFLMEIPDLRIPSAKNAFMYSWDRVGIFIKSTGKIIIASSVILWALSRFPGDNMQDSFAGYLGRLIQPLFAPMNFGWEVCLALMTSFAAREVFVSSLLTLIQNSSADLSELTAIEKLRLSGIITPPTAIALLVFFVFACQCFSTLVVTYKETNSIKWPLLMFFSMFTLAWGSAFIAYYIAKSII